MSVLEYLQKREWSMGNGQCPECYGVPESWHGHPCYMDAKTIGHEKGCKLAESLRDLGETPLMKGDFKTEKEYEHFISDNGFFGTRLKTKTGCPRYKERCEDEQKRLDDAMRRIVRKIEDDMTSDAR